MTSVFEWLFFKTPEKDQLYNWVKSNFTVIDANDKDLDLSKLKIDPSVCFINVNNETLKKLNIGSLIFNSRSNLCYIKTGEEEIKIVFKNGSPIILNMNALRESKLVKNIIRQLNEAMVFRTMARGDGVFYMKAGDRLVYIHLNIYDPAALICNVEVDLV